MTTTSNDSDSTGRVIALHERRQPRTPRTILANALGLVPRLVARIERGDAEAMHAGMAHCDTWARALTEPRFDEDDLNDLAGAIWDVHSAIAFAPATTPDAFRAKLKLAREWFEEKDGDVEDPSCNGRVRAMMTTLHDWFPVVAKAAAEDGQA